MTAGPAGRQPAFRELLCLLAAGVSVASMVELALIAHWHGGTQTMAWVAAWAGLTAAWLVNGPTGPRRLRAGAGLATGAVAIATIGVFVHLNKNLAFVTELHPQTGLGARLLDAARGGLPLLAPASLALPGLLVALATWRHPDGTLPATGPDGDTAARAIPTAPGRNGDATGTVGGGVFGPTQRDWTVWREQPEWPGPGRWGNLVAPAVTPAGAPDATAAATTIGTPVEERQHRGLSADRGGGPGADPADHPEPAGEAERLDPADEP